MIDGDDKKDKKVASMGELTDKEGGGVEMCARPYLVPILSVQICCRIIGAFSGNIGMKGMRTQWPVQKAYWLPN